MYTNKELHRHRHEYFLKVLIRLIAYFIVVVRSEQNKLGEILPDSSTADITCPGHQRRLF